MELLLTTHQQKAFKAIMRDIMYNLNSIFRSNDIEDHLLSLSGAAGTGKSYLTAQITKSLIAELRQHHYGNDGICITAPTHKAVKVLKGMLEQQNIEADCDCRTIHSFLNIKQLVDYNTGEEKFKVLRTQHNPPKASLLIVDESSMISRDLYSFIVDAFNMGRVNTVLFIGDPFQLLPVNNGENDIFKLKKQYTLTEIVRQAKDSNIIKLATKIRDRIERQDFCNLKELFNGSEAEDIEFFEDREQFIKDYYKNDGWFQEDKILTSYTNQDVDSFNKQIRDHFWQERNISNPPHFVSGDMVRFKSALNSDSLARLRNPTVYQNGEEIMIDKVEFITHQGSNIKYWKCTVVGRQQKDFFRVIDPDSLANFNSILDKYVQWAKIAEFPHARHFWKMYFEFKNAFADVQYIFAATMHKLQGSTYNTAYIDLSRLTNNEQVSNDLKFRLAYVAVTRARSNIKILF